jgi:hypothetical protein
MKPHDPVQEKKARDRAAHADFAVETADLAGEDAGVLESLGETVRDMGEAALEATGEFFGNLLK